MIGGSIAADGVCSSAAELEMAPPTEAVQAVVSGSGCSLSRGTALEEAVEAVVSALCFCDLSQGTELDEAVGAVVSACIWFAFILRFPLLGAFRSSMKAQRSDSSESLPLAEGGFLSIDAPDPVNDEGVLVTPSPVLFLKSLQASLEHSTFPACTVVSPPFTQRMSVA
jgi:hypothetical protein